MHRLVFIATHNGPMGHFELNEKQFDQGTLSLNSVLSFPPVGILSLMILR